MAEYRVWIDVPRLPFADEANWEPLMENLEDRHGDLGPVLGWENETRAQFVLACDAEGAAAAAQIAAEAVFDALISCGLHDRYPTSVEVEPVTETELELA
jgi:hypothetical protein